MEKDHALESCVQKETWSQLFEDKLVLLHPKLSKPEVKTVNMSK